MGFVGIARFSKAGTYDVVLQDGTTAALSVGRADFLVQPMRIYGLAFMAADPPIVIPKGEYALKVLAVLDAVFPLSERPLEHGRTYREPRWSLQIHSASVQLLPDGSVDVRSAHGSRGRETSLPYSSHVDPERYRTDLPRCILEALGERPEDVLKLLGRASERGHGVGRF